MNAAPPVLLIRPTQGWTALRFAELWDYRELLYFLIWRDVKVRYKQTALGIGWALLRPFLTMVLLSYVFGHLAPVPTDGVPYPLFCFCGILPWGYFSEAIGAASGSLVGNQQLVSKVYFPRIIIPLSAVGRGLVDFACSFVLLVGLLFWYGEPLKWSMLMMPLFLALAFAAALGVGIWFAAFSVRFRDVAHALPFFVQIWFWITPVAYGSARVPKSLQWLHWLNPMTGVVEGFRWAIVGSSAFAMGPTLVSAAVTLAVLAGGLIFFRRMERQFADLI